MAGKTVLIVEDTPANMELMCDLLAVAGYKVLEATTAKEGISKAKSEKPDVVLMDIGLAGMDGLEATRLLKADPETAGIPIICVTSHAMRGDEEKAIEAGCDGYMTKPLNTRTFASEVERLISAGGPACG